jgi:iron-sulfur cluster assembly protein
MLTLTEKAISEIKRIQSSTPESEAAVLRIMVTGGGCSGMSYKLGFDKQPPAENDKVFDHAGVKVVVDPKSYLFISDVVLDFSDGLNGKGFVFNNPNAKKTCGCGNSFST